VRELMDDQGVEALALDTDAGQIELIAPVVDDSGVARFLEARGPGLHHIAYEVDDLDAALDELAAAGFELIDRTPRRGLGGHRVAFIHPTSAGGALTELVEAAPDH
jgi:methylmalonyl-CoA/ethylmalonyl-CoA epimerase